MSEIKIGSSHPARRSGIVIVQESKGGALMVYLPFIICTEGVDFSGTHSICIGTKDGAMQEKSIATLKGVFEAWTSANPFDLQRLEFDPESGEPEFTLSDYQLEKKKNPDDADRYSFRWLNVLGSGLAPADEETEKAVMEKWGAKLSAIITPNAEEEQQMPEDSEIKKPAKEIKAEVVATKTKPTARKSTGAQARTCTEEEAWDAYLVKVGNPAEDSKEFSKAADHFRNTQGLVKPGSQLAENSGPEWELTLAQWGQVAEKLGV